MTNPRVVLAVLLACGPNDAWVQTASDQQSEIDSAYLVADDPAQLKISELESALGNTRDELTRSQAANLAADELAQVKISELESVLGNTREELTRSQAAQQTAELRTESSEQQIQAREDSSAVILETLTRLKGEVEVYEARMEAYRGSLPIAWVAAALGLTLVGGFLAGMRWLDFLSRRRHGGFRVY
ncbi:MAG: hypothetical protein O6700_06150 [Gammaproteobacteria bacterium]|nr:hypothetical protein [Gammaproteobacteria bacterium]